MSATVNGPTWDQRAADETENEKTTEGSPLTAVPESPGSGESIQHTPIRGRSIHPPRVANIPICTSCAKKDSLIPLKQLPAPIIPLVVSARGNTKSKPTHICPPCLRALLSNRLRQLLEDDARETGEFNDAAMRNLGEWEEQEGGWQGRFETSRTFGERAADGVAARGGSWR